jgi:hypothetical protein
MNTLTLYNIDQLSDVFNNELHLSGEQTEEIYYNMWCISLANDLIENITLKLLGSVNQILSGVSNESYRARSELVEEYPRALEDILQQVQNERSDSCM